MQEQFFDIGPCFFVARQPEPILIAASARASSSVAGRVRESTAELRQEPIHIILERLTVLDNRLRRGLREEGGQSSPRFAIIGHHEFVVDNAERFPHVIISEGLLDGLDVPG